MVIEVSGMYFFFWNHKHDFEIKEHDAQTLFTINYIALKWQNLITQIQHITQYKYLIVLIQILQGSKFLHFFG